MGGGKKNFVGRCQSDRCSRERESVTSWMKKEVEVGKRGKS